jgi:diguanylate cyclase (GGDEF)-like protein
MFQNINIGSRLGIGLILIFFILISLTLFGINRMNLLSSQTEQMYNHPLTVSNAVLRINANIIKIHRSMKDVALAQDLTSIEESVHIVDELEKDIYKDFEIINLRFLGEMKKYKTAVEVFTEWKPIRDNVIALMRTGQSMKAADITKGKGALHVVKIEKAMEALSNFAQKKASEFLNTTERSRISAFNTMYVSLTIALIVGVICAIYLTRSITVPLKTAEAAIDRIGEGKLDTTIDIKSKDEIGRLADSFNKMIRDLKKITTSRDELSMEISRRKKLEEELRALSLTDELTGLYNRRGFMTLADQQLKIANRLKGGVLILYADLDNMKYINDTYGHKAGDAALIQSANILKKVFRESDIIARIGGDEFVVFPVEISDKNVEALDERCQKYFEDYSEKRGLNYKLSVSIGIVHYEKICPHSIDKLLDEADKLMYEKKRVRES